MHVQSAETLIASSGEVCVSGTTGPCWNKHSELNHTTDSSDSESRNLAADE